MTLHPTLTPTAFAAHVARNRALDAPPPSVVLDDIAARICAISDRIVAEDIIYARARHRAIIGGHQCVWIADGDDGAYQPLTGMSDAEIDALMGVRL